MALAQVKQTTTPLGQRITVSFAEGDPSRPDLLGGKGAGLARMSQAGLPVPPGFVILTTACPASAEGWELPEELMAEVRARISEMEQQTGRTFGGAARPLLVSVRSGAQISMPGMMDTVLNLGLNAQSACALARETGDLAFAVDSYLRFGRMYGEIVLGADGELIAEQTEVAAASVRDGDADPAAVLESIEATLRSTLETQVGQAIPHDPYQQLARAIEAVFRSWNSRRAITYRELHGISHDLGTAVVVQAMVFGNLGSPSGTGVAFTRNPLTGERELYGEFLEGGQGEEVVAGTKTPEKLADAAGRLPDVFNPFREVAARLEQLYGDVLDIEFTVENGQLYLLQVRSAKRTAEAAIRAAADFLREGKLTPAQALDRVSTAQVRLAERPRFDEGAVERARAEGKLLGTGIGASPGHASGQAILDPDRAVDLAGQDGSRADVILLRPTTSPQDLHGMLAARGFLTALGGATSHAAVIARALDKPCVVGCEALEIDASERRFRIGDRWFEEGATVSIDGSSGQIFAGQLPMATTTESSDSLQQLLAVADEAARCRLYARTTTPEQVKQAVARGASGVTTRLGDILATSGQLGQLIDTLVRQAGAQRTDLTGFDRVIAELLEPVLAAAEGIPVAIRAIDFVGDEGMELLDAPRLFVQHPGLAVPLGVPELIATQVRGVSLAARAIGCRQAPQLTVRHITDPREAAELKRIADEQLGAEELAPVKVAATLTSPRAVQLAGEILRHLPFVWLEVRGLQASQFGYPPRLLLTREPLDTYVQRGMLSSDPRVSVGEGTGRLIAAAAAARVEADGGIGVRVTGPFGEEIARALLRLGFRTFAVDSGELNPAKLALGKAALAEE